MKLEPPQSKLKWPDGEEAVCGVGVGNVFHAAISISLMWTFGNFVFYCYPQVKRDNFGCSWHSNQLELGIFGDMPAYILVLTMTYLKENISLPLVWVHGHAARKTKKNLCVIEYSLYFRHLWCNLEDIQDFGQVPRPL